MTDRRSSGLKRVRAVAQIAYTELQYWCLGLTPESYHWKKGDAWDILGDHPRAAKHLAKYLEFADNAFVRGRLAFNYAHLGLWAEASEQYGRVNLKHPHPDYGLGHAKSELRLGNKDRASELLAEVQAAYPKLSQEHLLEMSLLQEEMRHGWTT